MVLEKQVCFMNVQKIFTFLRKLENVNENVKAVLNFVAEPL